MSVTAPRRAAYEVVRRVFEDGAWADRVLPAVADRLGLEGRERAQAQHLAYGAVKRRGTCDHLAAELAGRPVEDLDPAVRTALRVGIYELLFASATPDHAAVDQAVDLAKAGMRRDGRGGRRAEAAAGLVNAVLRRAARERGELVGGLDDATPAAAAVAWSCPAWLAELWWEELGADAARALLRAADQPPETALRVNTLRAGPAAVLAELRDAGEAVAPAEPVDGAGLLAPPEALVVGGPLGEATRARIASGELLPQARASQAVVELLGARPGERVLDLCAGPGVKTTAVAARLGCEGSVLAVELDPGRARQLAELCERTAARCVEVREADAAATDLGGGYDRVLVDPPCSDLGTLASRPDVRWTKGPETIARLAPVQAAILANGVAAVRPGGTLVYSTCTISRRENEDVVAATLDAAPGLAADDLAAEHPKLASTHDPRFLQIRPDRDGTDGFFVARLRRSEA